LFLSLETPMLFKTNVSGHKKIWREQNNLGGTVPECLPWLPAWWVVFDLQRLCIYPSHLPASEDAKGVCAGGIHALGHPNSEH